ncbi:tRNA dihydrouridine synthase [Desulfarculus baarsii]
MQFVGLSLQSPFFAAPMAGVSSPAFRLMAKRGGAGLVYTEMISAVGLVRGHKKTLELCLTLPEERPVALQLFGADPEVMGRAAALASQMPVDLIDVNMGCPARKVRRQGAGSALLEDIPRAAAVMAAVAQAASLPATVKLRLGPSGDDLERIVPPLLTAGAKAVCLHARTTRQAFAGQADWSAIARLADWCPVPVIGNGDVRGEQDAMAMLRQTNCQAVMIGRGAMGDPWIFGRAADLLAGRAVQRASLAQRRQSLLQHTELALSLGGDKLAAHFAKQFMMWHAKGLPGAADFRRLACQERELSRLLTLCEEFFDQLAARQGEQAA